MYRHSQCSLIRIIVFVLLSTLLLTYSQSTFGANANLFVSAENSQFDNYFGGPMVIEVVINDPDIKDTDELKGEPDVTVNGKILRMVQATDGLWYAYFADRTQAQLADQTVVDAGLGGNANAGFGLDFGTFCDDDSGPDVIGVDMGDSNGFSVAGTVADGTQGTTPFAPCSAPATVGPGNNVVRESKEPILLNNGLNNGQIGINIDAWPIIQLFDLNPTGNVVIQYFKGGNPQTVTLTFDTLDNKLDANLDRDIYPRSTAIHATLTDQAMNIDPTDEDSWTFDTLAGTVYYQLFDESGRNVGACFGTGNVDPGTGDCTNGGIISNRVADISGNLQSFLFEDGGLLFTEIDAQGTGTPVIGFQDNADQQFEAFDANSDGIADVPGFTQPVTIVELGPNSGVFASYDELDVSNMVITDDAQRGTSATITWDDTGYSIVVDFSYANIDIQTDRRCMEFG